jgi:hypothetical protein
MTVSTLCSNKTKGWLGGRFTTGVRKSQTTTSKRSVLNNSSIMSRAARTRFRTTMTGNRENNARVVWIQNRVESLDASTNGTGQALKQYSELRARASDDPSCKAR